LKIFITYASAGSGHRRAAEAIYNYLKANYEELDIKIIDVLDYANPLFKNLYCAGYAFIITKIPAFWTVLYWLTYNQWLRPLNKFINHLASRLNAKKFEQLLIAANPDIIVATHFLPIGIAGFLKKRHKINSRLICAVTDFDIHPFWVVPEIEQYVVGLSVTAAQLNSFGISNTKIKIMGIPVGGEFSENIEKEGIYKKLNLEKNKFTVLILTAAFGFGPIEEIVNLLYGQIQILVVCGRNTGLYRRLTAKKYNSVRIFGLVDNIEELMAAAHLVITKPGGLTTAEGLAMELPMIFFRAVYGQETKNAKILENYGVGINTKNLIDIREAVLNYKNNPQRLNAVKEKIRKIKKPNATREICAWLTSM